MAVLGTKAEVAREPKSGARVASAPLHVTRRERALATERAAHDLTSRSPLLVPELMARVRQIQIRTHRLVNTALSGGYRSTFRGSGIEFSEVRAYQPGDEVRRIDWNVTARTGDAFVKTYAEERELTLNLIVDTSRSMDFGSREWSKRETAAQFCALISFVAMRHQDRVGVALFGNEPGLHLPARKGGQHILRVVREVIAAPVSDGGSDFAAALEHQARVLRRRSVVFLVSDFLEPARAAVAPSPAVAATPLASTTALSSISSATVPAPRSTARAWPEMLARLSMRHDVIAVRIVDPFEEELPRAGIIGLSEVETGRWIELDTRSKAVREEWAARAQERRKDLLATFSRARADLIELDTTRDIGEAILAFFRKRMLRHGGPQ